LVFLELTRSFEAIQNVKEHGTTRSCASGGPLPPRGGRNKVATSAGVANNLGAKFGMVTTPWDNAG